MLYYEVEVFIRLASVSLFPAFWTFSQFLSIWRIFRQLIRNKDSKSFLVVKVSWLHSDRCFCATPVLLSLTGGSFLCFSGLSFFQGSLDLHKKLSVTWFTLVLVDGSCWNNSVDGHRNTDMEEGKDSSKRRRHM